MPEVAEAIRLPLLGRSVGRSVGQTGDIVIPIARYVLFGPTSLTGDTFPPSLMSEPSFRLRLVPAYPTNVISFIVGIQIRGFLLKNLISMPKILLRDVTYFTRGVLYR